MSIRYFLPFTHAGYSLKLVRELAISSETDTAVIGLSSIIRVRNSSKFRGAPYWLNRINHTTALYFRATLANQLYRHIVGSRYTVGTSMRLRCANCNRVMARIISSDNG